LIDSEEEEEYGYEYDVRDNGRYKRKEAPKKKKKV